MNPRLTALLVLAVVLAGGYWLYARDDESWRQKMIVMVSTPTGDVSGEAVTSVYVHKNNLFKDGAGHQFTIKGEAVVVDLGAGRYLFALLSSSDKVEHVAKLIPSYLEKVKGLAWDKANEAAPSLQGQITLPENLYPMLVTFADINDPKSVKEIAHGNMVGAFGPGYALKSFTLEITDDSVTEGKVEAVLRWLRSIWPNHLDGQRYWVANAPNRVANSISSNSFSTEISK